MDSRKKNNNNSIGLVRRPYEISYQLQEFGGKIEIGFGAFFVVVGATKLLSPISHCIVLLLLIWVGSELDSESIEASELRSR